MLKPLDTSARSAMRQEANLALSCLHDLRNPLSTIYASAELLTEFRLASPQVERLAANIYRAACRMRDILADLTHEARGNRPEVEMADISDIIARASEEASRGTESRSVQILLDLPSPMEMLLVRSRMERVFYNLVANSIQAMPAGGTIRIAARSAGDCVLVEVEDTGPGIPGQIRDRLFEPFVTADKENGLGLGLAISRQTVLDHGGDMWIEAAAGARFVICLPIRHSGFQNGCAPETWSSI
jgi:two-component system sensor histidine kinase PilS (NtrC family)